MMISRQDDRSALISIESVLKVSEVSQTDTSTQNQRFEIFRMKALEEFLKLKPPLFEGRRDPSAAQAWLTTVKAMLDSAGVLPEFRVEFAAYLLEGLAEEWYDNYVDETCWGKFEAAFRQTYIAAQTVNLRQKKLTVEAYRVKFDELSLKDPADSALTCAKFLDGLRHRIREEMVAFPIVPFNIDELFILASRVEADSYRRRRRKKGWLDVSSHECFICRSAGPEACGCLSRQPVRMTIAQYRDQFVEKFQPSDSKITSAVDRVSMCIRFKNGLTWDIRDMLKRSTFRDFDDLVGAAERVEAVIEPIRRKRQLLKEERSRLKRLKKEAAEAETVGSGER